MQEYIDSFLMPMLGELMTMLTDADIECHLTIGAFSMPNLAVRSESLYDEQDDVKSLAELLVTFMESEDESVPVLIRFSASAGKEECQWLIPYKGLCDTPQRFMQMARMFLAGAVLKPFPGSAQIDQNPDDGEKKEPSWTELPRLGALMEMLEEASPDEMVLVEGQGIPYIMYADEGLCGIFCYERLPEDENVWLLHFRADMPTDLSLKEAQEFCTVYNREHFFTRLTTETVPPSLFADEDARCYLTVHACLAEAAKLWPAKMYDAWLGSIEEEMP